MSESRSDPEVFWVDPRKRGVLPLKGFHVSRSLARTMQRDHFRATANTAFAQVLKGCADREETWINGTIFDLYVALHDSGYAHSVEVWEDEELVGGVYGVAIGTAFFGESMFSTRTDASKAALAWLIDRLRTQGFTLFDTQFITPHLASLGAVEIPRDDYHAALTAAIAGQAEFGPAGPICPAYEVVQRMTQTS